MSSGMLMRFWLEPGPEPADGDRWRHGPETGYVTSGLSPRNE